MDCFVVPPKAETPRNDHDRETDGRVRLWRIAPTFYTVTFFLFLFVIRHSSFILIYLISLLFIKLIERTKKNGVATSIQAKLNRREGFSLPIVSPRVSSTA